MRPTTQKMYVQKVVVRGTGRFPYDMLRYDGCVPWSEKDSYAINDDEGAPSLRTVELRRFCPNDSSPTIGRWESFGWKVCEHNFV